MFGKFKKGFTLIELMVVLFLLGLMATIVVPNLINQLPGYKRKQFIAHVSALARLSWQQALVQQKAYRLLFNFEKRMLHAQAETDQKDKDGKPKFEDVVIPYLSSTYQWPENIDIKQFYIDKSDVLARAGIKTDEAWFYFAPEGLVQSAIINMLDTNEIDEQGKALPFALAMNPYTGQFKHYDEFQKP